MASTLSILTTSETNQIQSIWSSNTATAILSRLVLSVEDGALSRDPAYNMDGLDVVYIATVRMARLRATNLQATVQLRELLPGATHAAVAVATTWDLTSEQKAELEKTASDTMDDDLFSRIQFTYDTCEAN